MSTAINTVVSFLHVWGPWIVASFLPSLIVGLSNAPKGYGLVGWLKVLLQLLSVLTHKDQPGTFKLPFTAKLPPSVIIPPPPPSAAAALLPLVFFLSISSTSCSWWQNHGEHVVTVVVDCTIEAVKKEADQLLPTVLAILTGNAIDWAQQLDALAAKMGQDALACAIQEAASEFEATGRPKAVPNASQGLDRAHQYISTHGIKYASPAAPATVAPAAK